MVLIFPLLVQNLLYRSYTCIPQSRITEITFRLRDSSARQHPDRQEGGVTSYQEVRLCPARWVCSCSR